jgi:hypothetical protein
MLEGQKQRNLDKSVRSSMLVVVKEWVKQFSWSFTHAECPA